MRVLIYLIVSLFFTVDASAKEVKDLFEVELIANSPSAEDRTQAMKQGMYAILNRTLVADNIANVPIAQQLMMNPQLYIKQFQYSLMPADQYTESDARMVRMEFDEDQILEILKQNPVSVWGEIRPETLLWLVVDEDGQRNFYNADLQPEIAHALSLSAKLKGLPILFPILDLEEQQKISVGEVLSADTRHLWQISLRYEVPAIMTGLLTKKGDCWQSEWAFYFDGKIKQWNSPCQRLLSAVQTGMDGAYGVLSNYYGAKPLTAK
jgi:uncharacterized protein